MRATETVDEVERALRSVAAEHEALTHEVVCELRDMEQRAAQLERRCRAYRLVCTVLALLALAFGAVAVAG